MTNQRINPETAADAGTIRTITRGTWLFWVILVSAGLAISPWFSLSVAAGGIVAIINFYWLRRQLSGLLGLSPRAATFISQAKAVARLALWGVVLYLLLVHGKLHPVGLLLGLSVPVFSIILLTGIIMFRKGGTS